MIIEKVDTEQAEQLIDAIGELLEGTNIATFSYVLAYLIGGIEECDQARHTAVIVTQLAASIHHDMYHVPEGETSPLYN